MSNTTATQPGIWTSRIVGHDRVAPDQLIANPYNHRKHPQRQRDALKASISEVGFIRSVTVNRLTGHVVDGHERVWQALQSEQPFIDVEYVELTEAEEKLALATMDSIGELATVDSEQLDQLLREIETGSEDLSKLLADMAKDAGLDFMQDELPEDPEPQIDRAAELQKEWGTETGQLWEIVGREQTHRLLCGDSTKGEDVGRLMGGEKADACITDPPFAIMGSSTGAKNDPSLIRPFFRMFWNAIKSTGAFDVYMFCDWRSFPTIHQEADGWDIKDVIVWDKKSGGLGNPYRRRHEFIVFARPAISDNKMMGRTVGGCSITDDDVWQCARVSDKEHNAQKPIPIVSRCIENSTSVAGSVFEPCGGSGTTLIAAEQLNRRCFGIEISPAYVAVALQRMKDMGCSCSLVN